MRHFFTIVLLTVLGFTLIGGAQTEDMVRLSTGYNWNTADTMLTGFGSIRGANFDDDLIGTGEGAIVTTNYGHDGIVHVFKVAGNDSIELVWTSPITNGSSSTPRYAAFGDLDNDGLKEVIYQNAYNGFLIYEWDGVEDSWNFGTEPSQVIDETIMPGADGYGYSEYFEIIDLDMDGVNELVTVLNNSGADNDGYYVIHANGEWSTNTPGFSGFEAEFMEMRPDHPNYGWGGSCWAMITANLDGMDEREVLIHNWNFKNVTPLRVDYDEGTGETTYTMADTTNDKQNYFLHEYDGVSLFSGFAYDVDSDGREEVYMPSFYSSILHMVYWDEGHDLAEIDSSNVFALDMSSVIGGHFGFGYGDIDGDENPNLYISNSFGSNVVTAEFQGGDKTDIANWTFDVVYKGDSTTHLTEKAYFDSAGVKDTSFTYLTWPFVSKMVARHTDFDKDGFEDMILPYQTIYDSIDVFHYDWLRDTSYTRYDTSFAGTDSMEIDTVDVFNSIWDTTATAEINPKRWSLRVVEGKTGTGIEAKDITVITPSDFELKQNYPNPFNPTTNIEFYLPVNKRVTLTIYNTLGQKVKELVSDKMLRKGNHVLQWNSTNEAGARVASGMYIYELEFGNFTKQKRMMLIK
ncbi:MAG: T9SS type A sorting domain-containing protein [Caldithrix sp.]|nr:T9SS type A sorting domain-containing protein [Caldithrix sp.]